MKQIWIPHAGAPEVLDLREAPDPAPAAGEVRVRVEAAGINFADIAARLGNYPDAPPFPFVPGYEVAGRIDAVGDGVDAARVGEDVFVMTRFGGYSSVVCVPANSAIVRPPGMSAEVGAALPVNYLTAWMMLRVMGRVEAGDRVFIHSAAGGVGLASIDLCRAVGAEIWGSAGQGKHAFLAERGVHHLLDSRADEWPTEGMDLVLDPIGGRSWARGLEGLRSGGRLVAFGFSAGSTGSRPSKWNQLQAALGIPWLQTNPVALINANKGVLGVNMGHLWHEADRVLTWTNALVALWSEGKLRPHVHASFPFERAADAHALIHRRENIGKVLLTP
jgi:NADPH:quinone reductase-like Zn-dependent oxidoreductase